LFGITLAALAALGTWWFIFFERTVALEQSVLLKELRAAVTVAALTLGHRREPPSLGPLEGAHPLEVVPAGEPGAEELYFMPTLPRYPGYGVRIAPQAVKALDDQLQRRRFMVQGEGGLLLVLIVICTYMLYRLVRQERRSMQRMESFLSSVTHEMKTPIAGLKSMLQTFAAGKVPEKQATKLFAMGLKETERLEHMIENVLISGRLRADVHQIRLESVEMRGLLERFVAHRKRYLVADPDAVRLEWAVDRPESHVRADAGAVLVVLENLTDNAFKYGGTTPHVLLRARVENGQFAVSVQDKGIGFSPELAAALFTPFHRTSEAKGAVQHGTGLGLTIARALAKKMDGDLTARSEGPGKGSEFTLFLKGVDA
jgi:signal transduction histidine kinase